ncbi:unnamed protein product [Arabis nemorensis]|uniref:Uncharacterized protein n=1 Tax=Arabis nemorensis TaxID=586526 RepID=A0A565B7T3_9BRAS|nr:unnamed protein product [Arabis nemorensis]
MADSSSNKELYTPPSRRGQDAGTKKPTGNHKKGGDRDSGQQNKDGEKSQPQIQKTPQRIITLKDCSKSEAYQLLSQRWATAMHLYNDPTVDLSERPIMYYGGSVWGKLPHQILASANKTLPPPSDYLPDVRRRGLLTPKPR